MVQKIFGIVVGATGIVGTLIVAGILLHATKVSPSMGSLAIAGGYRHRDYSWFVRNFRGSKKDEV